MAKVASLFAEDGVLAQVIDGFSPREAQVQMASAVAKAIAQKQALLVEAGTGTGKTFAYLAPALKSKVKTIISTGTKNLQEQLYHRDLPLLKKAIAAGSNTALLKGRANYLCIHRLRQHSSNSTLFEKQTLAELSVVRKWSSQTKSGDIGELKSLPEDAKILPFVTSTVDNCLGKDCPDYADCHLLNARRKALEADLVVVNHHLFFADMALKDTGFGELIPHADLVVFDEAHQLPDIATQYFGQAVSSRQIQELCQDINMLQRTVLKDAGQLAKAAEKCRMIVADLRLLFPQQPQRGNWEQMLKSTDIRQQVDKMLDCLDMLYEVIKLHLGRDKDLDNIFERVSQTRSLLHKICLTGQQGITLWYETSLRHIVLHQTPLNIADKFRDFMSSPERAWVFTSATLVVDQGFSHFQQQMGLDEAETLALDSPFDYPNQALLCVPRFLPEPSSRQMQEVLLDIAIKLVKASKGRCFLLFTSHAMLRHIAKQLQSKIDNPVLVQGTTTKQALLSQYLENKNAVLLGTGAFWEGVDVRGRDLTCVLIDKLPFAAPDDPLLQARIDDCRKRGANPFATLQIPQAVITLKQGAGRLIRDETDRGVLVICDNRLVTRDYGRTFVASLPAMQRTRDLAYTLEFLEKLN